MVTEQLLATFSPLLWGDGLLDLLAPENRAKVQMTLVALLLVAIFLVLLPILGARWARRMIRYNRAPKRPPIRDDWYREPLEGHEQNDS